MDLVVVFRLFVLMLALLFFFDAAVFSVNKDLYNSQADSRREWTGSVGLLSVEETLRWF